MLFTSIACREKGISLHSLNLLRNEIIVMITSKLTSKAQTTIPQPVRVALHLHDGDEIAYRIVENHVILTKA
ncbi:MAG: type II toxin-antitoxin system PrlF family antitoxin, partial [Acidithiobacillus sp.]